MMCEAETTKLGLQCNKMNYEIISKVTCQNCGYCDAFSVFQSVALKNLFMLRSPVMPGLLGSAVDQTLGEQINDLKWLVSRLSALLAHDAVILWVSLSIPKLCIVYWKLPWKFLLMWIWYLSENQFVFYTERCYIRWSMESSFVTWNRWPFGLACTRKQRGRLTCHSGTRFSLLLQLPHLVCLFHF